MYDIPDHPIIRNLEQTGYPDRRKDTEPRCPICGAYESEWYVRGKEVVGCWNCVQMKESWEVENG